MCVELEKRSQSKSKSVEQERVQAATGQRHKSKVRVLSARAFPVRALDGIVFVGVVF